MAAHPSVSRRPVRISVVCIHLLDTSVAHHSQQARPTQRRFAVNVGDCFCQRCVALQLSLYNMLTLSSRVSTRVNSVMHRFVMLRIQCAFRDVVAPDASNALQDGAYPDPPSAPFAPSPTCPLNSMNLYICLQ
ncbi:hypothetical protein BD626DRAFT_16292 [Schizophyllum amplum]|uniref:Uncharacterized protein n=1 Tax=Schizophyllum amplum TaxID=97359 RepID=A0A550CXZ7_9AGAR|nr:hypothetical protein BD626DRAFT_16292 [Auriculariopsis ampla]